MSEDQQIQLMEIIQEETEMNILHKLSHDDLEAVVGEKVAKTIIDAREGKASIQSGGGGIYGKLTVG